MNGFIIILGLLFSTPTAVDIDHGIHDILVTNPVEDFHQSFDLQLQLNLPIQEVAMKEDFTFEEPRSLIDQEVISEDEKPPTELFKKAVTVRTKRIKDYSLSYGLSC